MDLPADLICFIILKFTIVSRPVYALMLHSSQSSLIVNPIVVCKRITQKIFTYDYLWVFLIPIWYTQNAMCRVR